MTPKRDENAHFRTAHTYPAELAMAAHDGRIDATVSVPGSKSITNRALVLAALASRESVCELTGALQSEDTEVMVDCLTQLGFAVTADWPHGRIAFAKNTSGRIIPAKEAKLFVGNSGTTVRFLTAMLGLGQGRYELDGIARMRERPIQDLLSALHDLGVNATSQDGTGCPPVTIHADGWKTNRVAVRGSISSQFLSGLLLASPFAGRTIDVVVTGELVSVPYVDMTLRMLTSWGGHFQHLTSDNAYRVEPISYTAANRPPLAYAIEPDASSASYFFAAAAIHGGRVRVRNMPDIGVSLQGDVRFAQVLEKMGCAVRADGSDTVLRRDTGTLRGIDVDMNDISDTVMTLAAVACFAEGPTTIRNVAHIRHKETDRIAAVAIELRKFGVTVDEREDGLTIHPVPLASMTGCAVDTYNDHRMAMSFALIARKVPGTIIRNPACVAKTYPGFWVDFERCIRTQI